MATHILLRSPFLLAVTTGSHLSAKLALTVDGTLRYTIIKDATSNVTVFDISSLSRDYYAASPTTLDTVSISATWYAYDAVNGGGSQIIYLPESTAGYAYDMNSGTATKATISTSATSVAAASGNTTWTIERICSPKYTPVLLTFINKNGVPQEQYFFLKSSKTISTKAEKFKRNIFQYTGNRYTTTDHQQQTFNKNGVNRYTLNTDYISEAYVNVMQDIMLSEYVWIKTSGSTSLTKGETRPVNVTSNSLVWKTSLNDRLIQYTLEVEDSNDYINNIL